LHSLWNFIKRHWQLFAYVLIGIAGAFLVPLINELTNNGLRGIDRNKTQVHNFSVWDLLVLLGYGIVFGYSAVRVIRNIGALLLGNITKQQQDLQKKLEEAQKQIDELKAKLPGQSIDNVDLESIETSQQLNENFGDDTIAQEELNEVSLLSNCDQNPPPWKNKPWRPSDSLKVLLMQIDNLAFRRKKTSDGTIGDLAHQQRVSDHNPWVLDKSKNIGVVTL
jgi:hypothetical protein